MAFCLYIIFHILSLCVCVCARAYAHVACSLFLFFCVCLFCFSLVYLFFIICLLAWGLKYREGYLRIEERGETTVRKYCMKITLFSIKSKIKKSKKKKPKTKHPTSFSHCQLPAVYPQTLSRPGCEPSLFLSHFFKGSCNSLSYPISYGPPLPMAISTSTGLTSSLIMCPVASSPPMAISTSIGLTSDPSAHS